MNDKYTRKIMENAENDIFIVFYSDWCKYSTDVIQLLERNDMSYKGYQIDKIKGGMDRLLKFLIQSKDQTDFDPMHNTRPIIFYRGKFIGGYTEMRRYIGNIN